MTFDKLVREEHNDHDHDHSVHDHKHDHSHDHDHSHGGLGHSHGKGAPHKVLMVANRMAKGINTSILMINS